ncbi:P-loop NTPase fold protein [Myceligenerans crystallogenes]|uniref:KAP NTPase domain-containing protein n=1 Tax=Myceligenerans crystallogenes TaxID=316335 RepID=A0ABN2N3U6_9MICO
MNTEERDHLAFRSHANALARLIAARATAPPLAVALLAEWGGGKSAFLRLLGDAIEGLTTSGDAQVVDRLSVVRFNAWHRSDRSVLVGIFGRVVEAFGEHDHDARDVRRDGARRRAARRRAAAVGWIERLDEREERLEHEAARPAPGPWSALWRRLKLVALVPWALVQGSWRTAAVLTVLLVVALALVLGPFVLPLIDKELNGWLSGAEAWVNGALASSGVAALVAALVAVYRMRVRRAAGTDEDGAGSLAGLIAATIDQERDKAEARIAEIDAEDATRGIADLVHDGDRRARLEAARGFVGHLGNELGDFAEQVAAAEDYWRRRAQADGGGTDRVVLLVDDLDRCPPERVVEVLHALAMLQYTSLFVVVIAADPRWLRRSVEVAGDRTGTEGSHLEGYVDDAVAYLDAAFQIPFALPQTVRSDGGRYLLATAADQDLLPPRIELTAAGLSRVPVADPGPAAVLGEPQRFLGETAPFTPHEIRTLAAVSGVLPHPRAVKKFLVLYRLVRMGTHLPGHARFTDRTGEHRPVAVLLALLVGVPAQAAQVLRQLDDVADDAALADVVASLSGQHAVAGHEPCGECLAWRRTRAVVAQAAEAGAPLTVGPYRGWADEVSRFSFRTDHLA